MVYKALDREREDFVALKTLRHVAPEALYRFKQEFRALADVSHPNLVELYELSSDGEQLFFTMELVDGVNFLVYVRHAEAFDQAGSGGSPFSFGPTSPTSAAFGAGFEASFASPIRDGPVPAPDIDRLRSALLQLARGVSALHQAGKLHRDIKPSNVMVTRQGRVALLDFGLVKELDLVETHTQQAIGTPAYMSPEQAGGRALTEKSDWYSVGCMLYEALSGRLPFHGRILDVLREKQERDPPAPRELAPGVPEDLDALCSELLRRDPEQRPAGADVLKRLEGVAAQPRAARLGSSAEAVAPFVGRGQELEALREAFDAMTRGQAVTVSIQGGSGVGKSALVRYFLDELLRDHAHAVVLAGRCHERESVPYKALDALIDALSQQLRRLPSAHVEALLPHDIQALVRLFPVLRQVGAVARSRRAALEIPDSQELRRRAFSALRELFVRIADRRPLVLFIDDIQWGDADSALLLEALLRPPDSPTLLLIACYRSEEADTSPLLRTVLPLRQNVGPALTRRDIVLRELSFAEAQELALALLTAGDLESLSTAQAIARESGGNPFFLEEHVRFTQAVRGAQLASRGAPAVTLRQVIEARVSRLSDAERRLLEVVTVAGQPIEIGVACQAAQLDLAGTRALAALRAVHLVRTRATALRTEIEPYHDRIRQAVVARLDAAALRECHHQLALALLASGRADPEQLAALFHGAGDARSAAEYATAAAAKAWEALAFDRAASLYGFALAQRSEAGLDEGDLRVRLADALANAGRGVEAAQTYLVASKGVGEALAIDLHRRAAYQFLITGRIEDGRRAMNTVLLKLGMSFPRTPRAALFSLLVGRAALLLRGLHFKERDETQVSPQALLRIDTCWSVAVGLSQFDMLRGADFQARSLLRALRVGEPYRVARALALESTYVAMGGSRTRRRTERLLGVARQLAERVGNPHAVSLQTLTAGTAAWLEGRWKDSLELCERAEGLLRERCSGVIWEIMSAQMFQLGALFFLGEIKELQRRLPALVKEAEQRGSIVSTFLRIGYCFHMAWLAADDPASARQELESGLQGWSGQFDYLHMWARAARTDIALYSGEAEQLPARLADKWRPVARALDRFVQAGYVRGLETRARRCLAEAARAESAQQREALLRRAEKNARAIRRQRTHWGDPLALVLEACVAVSRGDPRAAAGLLEDADAGFRRADMALHAAVASRRRGQLMDGAQGRERIAAADAWMAAQRIVDPSRLSSVLAPGPWPAA